MDPADGQLHKYSLEKFKKIWTGALILLVPSDDFKSGKERQAHEYEEQLEFYKKVMEYKKLEILASEICWLG
jgi:ATP-binding cassette subfamily B protein